MAKTRYQVKKRQKELLRKKKKEQKRQRKLDQVQLISEDRPNQSEYEEDINQTCMLNKVETCDKDS